MSETEKSYDPSLKFNAESEALPEEIQATLLLKILTYDRSLEDRVKDTIHVGIVYLAEKDQSRKNKDAMVEYLKLNQDKTINGSPFRIMEIKYGTETNLGETTKRNDIDVIYVTCGADNVVESISRLARTHGIMTITGQPSYVNRGLAVGLGIKEQKPEIIINLPSARAEGSDFSSSLLKLCRVIN